MTSAAESLDKNASLRKLSYAASGLAALGLVAGVVYGAYRGVDWVGHQVVGNYGPAVTFKDAQATALSIYDRDYMRSSAVGKFELQYLDKTSYYVAEYPRSDGLSSLSSSADYWHTTIGSACLKNSAFDISGGHISGSETGLFSSGSVSGNVPAAAYALVNPNNPNQLIISSVGSRSTLSFDGLTSGETLTPANATTKDIIDTYGCDSEKTVTTVQDEDYTG